MYFRLSYFISKIKLIIKNSFSHSHLNLIWPSYLVRLYFYHIQLSLKLKAKPRWVKIFTEQGYFHTVHSFMRHSFLHASYNHPSSSFNLCHFSSSPTLYSVGLLICCQISLYCMNHFGDTFLYSMNL